MLYDKMILCYMISCYMINNLLAQSAGAVEYTDCISAEG